MPATPRRAVKIGSAVASMLSSTMKQHLANGVGVKEMQYAHLTVLNTVQPPVNKGPGEMAAVRATPKSSAVAVAKTQESADGVEASGAESRSTEHNIWGRR